MNHTVTFREIKIGGDKVTYLCKECGKKRTKVVSRFYFQNGFHNEDETREKLRVGIAREKADLAAGLGVCASCRDRIKEETEGRVRECQPRRNFTQEKREPTTMNTPLVPPGYARQAREDRQKADATALACVVAAIALLVLFVLALSWCADRNMAHNREIAAGSVTP